MERNRARWQPLSAARTSGSQSAQPGETTGSMQPWQAHSSTEEQMLTDQNTVGNTVNPCLSTSSAFCKQHNKRHVASQTVKANKDGNNLRGEVSIRVPPGPQRLFA